MALYLGSNMVKVLTDGEYDPMVPDFTDALSISTDANGDILNGVGHNNNVGYYYTNGSYNSTSSGTYFHTGFIPIVKGDVIRGYDLSFHKQYDGYCQIIFFDSSYTWLRRVAASVLVNGSSTYYAVCSGDDSSFELTVQSIVGNDSVAYAIIQVISSCVGDNPYISVNEEISFHEEYNHTMRKPAITGGGN